MYTLSNRCTECDCMLWSAHAKGLGVCPECETPDEETADLETQIENLIGG